MYQFYEPVYFRIHEEGKRSPEELVRWVGATKDMLSSFKYIIQKQGRYFQDTW